MSGPTIQKVAIAGFGAIGGVVAEHLDPKFHGGIDGLELAVLGLFQNRVAHGERRGNCGCAKRQRLWGNTSGRNRDASHAK